MSSAAMSLPVIERVVRKLGGRKALGGPVASEADLARVVDHGMGLRVLDHVRKAGFSRQEIDRLIIPRANLATSRGAARIPVDGRIRSRRPAHPSTGSGGRRILRRCKGEYLVASAVGRPRWKMPARRRPHRCRCAFDRADSRQTRLGRCRLNASVAAFERTARTRIRRRLWHFQRWPVEHPRPACHLLLYRCVADGIGKAGSRR